MSLCNKLINYRAGIFYEKTSGDAQVISAWPLSRDLFANLIPETRGNNPGGVVLLVFF